MKKGQVQLNETILVIFAIVMIIIAGMFVYFKYSSSRISRMAFEMSEQESTILIHSFTQLPEVGCAHNNCVDAGKLLPFMRVIESEKGYYSKIFGAKTISVRQLYPVSSERICDIDAFTSVDYPQNCDTWMIYDGKPRDIRQRVVVSSPVSLYFPEDERYTLGRVDIEIYA